MMRPQVKRLGYYAKQCAEKLLVRHASSGQFNRPLSGNDLPRPAGIASLFRLPIYKDAEGLDVCYVGVAVDSGTSNRTGARFGPRQIRAESVMIRPYNTVTGANPFESLQVGDVGDVPCTVFDLPEACNQIREHFRMLTKNGCKAIAVGGDHTITYPILQAAKEVHGPVGLIHIDAHNDTTDNMFGTKIAHGTPFRRAVEEGLLDCNRVWQIGLRGTGYTIDDYQWGRYQGFRVVLASDCWHKSLAPLMEEIRSQIGSGPVYLSFDIDGIDPAFAPGTGTPEIAGLTTIQALEIIRGCRGINLIGADVVEVAPCYDTAGITSILAANLLFEILSVFPGVKYNK